MARQSRTALDRELSKFVKHAYTHAPAVRKILDEAGVQPSAIKTLADYERVPVTRKDQLIQLQQQSPPFGGFLAADVKQLKHVYLSPGPLFEPHGKEKVLAQVAAQIFRIAGFKRGEMALNTLSYHLSPGGWLLEVGLRQAGVCVIPGGVGSTELQVKTLRELNIQGYAGTPSFLMALIKKAEELGMDFKKEFALHHALFTAEPYPPSLREQFEAGYGLKTTNVYATGEMGLLAYECKAQAGLHLADGIILELVNPTTGTRVAPHEPGEIVVTTFNETYPILRLGTGDLATYTDEPCACGRRSPRLLGLLGRVGDAVKVRGMFVHPNQLKTVMARFPGIARMRGVITREGIRDGFRLEIELVDPAAHDPALDASVREAVRNLCHVGVDEIAIVPTGTLPANGKLLSDERKWE